MIEPKERSTKETSNLLLGLGYLKRIDLGCRSMCSVLFVSYMACICGHGGWRGTAQTMELMLRLWLEKVCVRFCQWHLNTANFINELDLRGRSPWNYGT